jgi:hypothetical protein
MDDLIEVLDYGPEDDAPQRLRLGGWWPRPGRGRIAVLVVVVLVGFAVGAGATWAIDRHGPPAQVAPSKQVAVAAVVVAPPGGTLTVSREATAAVSSVDFAILNEGTEAISSVSAQWLSLDQTEVGAPSSVETIGRLNPHTPAALRLQLRRTCGTSATASTPTLLLTWALAGQPQRLVVAPFGLDQVWTALPAYCPSFGNLANPLDVSVTSTIPAGAQAVTLNLTVTDPADGDFEVSNLDITGGFTQVTPAPPSFLVHAHASVAVQVTVRVTNCRDAIERSYTAGLTYLASSTGAEPVSPTVNTADLAKALGNLFYQACGKPTSSGPARISAVVVAPTHGAFSTTRTGTAGDVDVAITNDGPDPVDAVVASWQGAANAPVGTEISFETVGSLAPATPETVSLPLWRPCRASASPDPTAPPTLLLTWTQNGVDKRQTIVPSGLRPVWSALSLQCAKD